MKIIKRDANLFLELSEHLLQEGYRVRFRAAGTSMQPEIGDGSALIVGPVHPVAVQPGDILFFRNAQRGIAHRVVHVEPSAARFHVRGDAKPTDDAPVGSADVLGKVVAVEDQRADPWRAWRSHFLALARQRMARLACSISSQIGPYLTSKCSLLILIVMKWSI